MAVMWYRDPRHPELGAMYCPDSEAHLAVPPGMEVVPRPAEVEQIARVFDVPAELIERNPAPDVYNTIRALTDPEPEAWPAGINWVDIGATVDDGHAVGFAFYLDEISAANLAVALNGTGPDIRCLSPGCENYGDPDFGEGTCPPDHATLIRSADTEQTMEITNNDRRAYGLTASKEERDRRLAEGRCYWCGIALNTDDPFELFDSEHCERSWRIETQADVRSGGITVNPNGSSGYAGEDAGELRPEPGEEFPRWLGTPRRDLGLNRTPLDLPEDPPEDFGFPITEPDTSPIPAVASVVMPPTGWRNFAETMVGGAQRLAYGIRDVPPLPQRFDYKIHATRDGRRYGRGGSTIPTVYAVTESEIQTRGIVVASLDAVGQRATEGFAIGAPWVFGEPALRELDHGPFGDTTGWPMRRVQRLQAEGFALALPPGLDEAAHAAFLDVARCPLLPERQCPRCGQREMPMCHEAQYPEVVRQDRGAIELALRQSTHVVCGGCLLPYPGPILAPMWREHPGLGRAGAVELAVVHARGVIQTWVSREALEYGRGDTRAMVWRDLWERALDEASGWGCVVPGCSDRARNWVAVSAPMRAWGWMAQPHDQEPLIMGVCPGHWMDLHRDLYVDLRTYERAAHSMVHGQRLLIL